MTPRYRFVLTVVVLAAAIAAALREGLRDSRPAGDFLRYDRAGILVWRGQADRIYDDLGVDRNIVWNDPENLPEARFRYSPALAVLLSPLGALPVETSWVIWSAICGALTALGAGLAAAMAVRRLPGGNPAWIPVAAAVLPLLHLYAENIKLGQMNCFAFGFCMIALYAFDRGRNRTAGLFTAGAVVAKHIPLLLVLYFAWKRRWGAALWSLVFLGTLLYVVPTVVLGPRVHHGNLSRWTDQQDHLITEIDEPPGMRASESAVHVEGQSMKGLLYRYLTPTSFFHLKARRGPGDDRPGSRGIAVNGGRAWPARTVFNLWLGASLVVLLTVVLAVQPVRGEDPAAASRRFPLEAGLILLAMVLISPESRNPHFQMLAPSYAALAAILAARRPRSPAGWVPVVLCIVAALGVLLPTRGLIGRDAADHLLARGTIGFGAIVIFAVVSWLLLRERAEADRMAEAAERAAATAGGAAPA